MKMPGFTADVSAYKTSRHYRMAGTPDALASRHGVVPQAITAVCIDCIEGIACIDLTGGGARCADGRGSCRYTGVGSCQLQCGDCELVAKTPGGGGSPGLHFSGCTGCTVVIF